MIQKISKLLALVFLTYAGSARAAETVWKVLVEEPPGGLTGECIPNDDTEMVRSADSVPAIGLMAAGGCVDAWSSGVNFTGGGWRVLRHNKHHRRCDKELQLQTTVNLKKGKHGTLEDWNCAPVGATANPCLHTDGKTYLKCDAKTDHEWGDTRDD